MSKIKYIFHIKGLSRGIIITEQDTGKNIDEISSEMNKILSIAKVISFKTNRDLLFVRSSDIISIQIEIVDRNEVNKKSVDLTKESNCALSNINADELEDLKENIDIEFDTDSSFSIAESEEEIDKLFHATTNETKESINNDSV